MKYRLLALILLLSPLASAWAPSTHAYIAWRLHGDLSPELFLGAMAPDMAQVERSNPAIANAMQHLLHFHPELMPEGPFALGLYTHNGEWGGDSYAHAYFDPNTTKLYPKSVMQTLSGEFGISMGDAENFVEAGADIVVRYEWGEQLADALNAAANEIGPALVAQIQDAYAGPLAQAVPGLALEQARERIAFMATGFQMLLRTYAGQMELDETGARQLAIQLLVGYYHLAPETATQRFDRTMQLLEGLPTELDAQIAEIAASEKENVPYNVPLDSSPIMIALLFAGILCCGRNVKALTSAANHRLPDPAHTAPRRTAPRPGRPNKPRASQCFPKTPATK